VTKIGWQAGYEERLAASGSQKISAGRMKEAALAVWAGERNICKRHHRWAAARDEKWTAAASALKTKALIASGKSADIKRRRCLKASGQNPARAISGG